MRIDSVRSGQTSLCCTIVSPFKSYAQRSSVAAKSRSAPVNEHAMALVELASSSPSSPSSPLPPSSSPSPSPSPAPAPARSSPPLSVDGPTALRAVQMPPKPAQAILCEVLDQKPKPPLMLFTGAASSSSAAHHLERRFQCSECPKRFSRRAGVLRHLRVHTGERPYPCTICNRAFAELGALKRHVRVHSGERPFQCDQCESAFAEAGSLKRHLRVHSGERPFQCPICNRCFSRPHIVTKHMRCHEAGYVASRAKSKGSKKPADDKSSIAGHSLPQPVSAIVARMDAVPLPALEVSIDASSVDMLSIPSNMVIANIEKAMVPVPAAVLPLPLRATTLFALPALAMPQDNASLPVSGHTVHEATLEQATSPTVAPS